MNHSPDILSSRRPSAQDYARILGSDLFRDMSCDALEYALEHCRIISLAAGSTLLPAGADNDRIYLVLDGRLHVLLEGERSNHLVTLREGECVGEMSIIDGGETSAEVVALSDCELLEIEQELAWSLIQGTDGVAANLLRVMAKRVRHGNATVQRSLDLQRSFKKAAVTDALTGLHNRAWLDEAFVRALTRAHQSEHSTALLLVDVDHFKRFNDVHGHLAGDAVLRAVARTVADCLRPSDLLARFGGEEFALMLVDADMAACIAVAERLRHAVGMLRIRNADGLNLPQVTVSIGMAMARPAEQLSALLERADRALYRAKQEGRDRIARDPG